MKNYYKIDSEMNFVKIKENPQDSLSKKKSKIKFAKYLGLGYYLVTPILLGLFLGLFGEKVLKTGNVFFIICFSLGVVGSFYNLYKIYIDERTSSG